MGSSRIAGFLFALDAILCVAILWFSRYTEVDWIAYMQEAEGYINGQLDYKKLKGNTGPLVYPAGFVYIFGALRFLTKDGTDVVLAQALFAALYLVMMAFVFGIYRSTKKVPFLGLLTLVISKRIHSIFLLRMFNDGVAMVFLYVAIFLMTDRKWTRACVAYSLAVSVKMNIFLFAPGMLLVMIKALSPVQVVLNLGVCALVQVVLGAPFLMFNWVSYLSKAFELSRVFTYKWTVNYKFLSEEVFIDPRFGMLLLGLTLLSWAYLCKTRWMTRDMKSPEAIVATLFESNMIGLIFTRTFHYQFYVWFFHQLPFVLFVSCDRLPKVFRYLIIGCIECGFWVYPSVWWSSLALQASLFVMWAGMMVSKDTS